MENTKTTNQPTYSLFVKQNGITHLIANSSPNNYNDSYLPLCQLAVSQYNRKKWYIQNNLTGEIIRSSDN